MGWLKWMPAVSINRMPRTVLGGVTIYRLSHLKAMNGASNLYPGWGGEDDEFYNRVRYIHQHPHLSPFPIGQFYEAYGHVHPRDPGEHRFEYLANSSALRMLIDGYRQTSYRLVQRKDFSNFIWLLVDL